ncbi:MAG: Gfo/Idh/MocA family oxidoreductase [Candidatus Eremiobacterota bacterium]
MPLKVALIGTGYMARKHADMLAGHPQANLAVVCSTGRSASVAREFRDTYGFRHQTTDWEAIASDPSVDVVFVCSPDATHADCTAGLLEAGKHVLCEKPLATSEPDFDRLRRALARGGGVLQVGMNCRYREQYERPQRLVASSSLGRLRFVRGTYLYNSVEKVHKREKAWWFDHPKDTFFFLHGGGIHCIDLLQWIGGPVRSVHARATGFELGTDFKADTFSVSLEFESGIIGELLVSSSAFLPRDFTLEFWLSEGAIRGTTVYRREGDLVSESVEVLPVLQPLPDLHLQFDELVNAVRHGEPIMNCLDEAYENYCIIRAVERSVRERRPIAVESPAGVGLTPGSAKG